MAMTYQRITIPAPDCQTDAGVLAWLERHYAVAEVGQITRTNHGVCYAIVAIAA